MVIIYPLWAKLSRGFCVHVSSLCFISFLLVQNVPEKKKDASGGPWQLVGLLPLFDPPRHDSAETIRRALNLGVNVKMITGKNHTILVHPCLSPFHFAY